MNLSCGYNVTSTFHVAVTPTCSLKNVCESVPITIDSSARNWSALQALVGQQSYRCFVRMYLFSETLSRDELYHVLTVHRASPATVQETVLMLRQNPGAIQMAPFMILGSTVPSAEGYLAPYIERAEVGNNDSLVLRARCDDELLHSRPWRVPAREG